MPILQTMLVSYTDTSVQQLSGTDVYETVFDVGNAPDTGAIVISAKNPAPRTEYIVALYHTDGTLIDISGGDQDPALTPVFPTTLTVQDAFLNQDRVFALDTLRGSSYRASVSPVEVQSGATSGLYAQLVAQPLTEADSFVRTYIVVFTGMTAITLVLGALVTRWLVTLAFRRLGQVEDTAMRIAEGNFQQRMTDIEPTTEVGRLKLAINTMLDTLDESFAERDATVDKMRRFIGDASHELRTPLVSVRGYAELFRMGAINTHEDTGKAMQRIESEAKRMTSLVEDLLNLARLDERREMEITDVDLRTIARNAALDVQAADPGRRINVNDTTFEALTGPITIISSRAPHAPDPAPLIAGEEEEEGPPTETAALRWTSAIAKAQASTRSFFQKRGDKKQDDDTAESSGDVHTLDFSEPVAGKPLEQPPIVRGNAEKIQQVIANLLGNARRYSAEDSPIELEVGIDPEKDLGWISVVDHGEGIPEEIRQKIFERFWRADTSRARETGGSGLGLAIVASIVERLKGSVSVFETPGGGATFQVGFPLVHLNEVPKELAE
nr:HAMP domain-containing sensor histidine kinase [Microbacterium amylolyticum]